MRHRIRAGIRGWYGPAVEEVERGAYAWAGAMAFGLTVIAPGALPFWLLGHAFGWLAGVRRACIPAGGVEPGDKS